MTTIAQQVEVAMHDVRGDYPDVDESTMHHDCAENICYEFYHTSPAGKAEANDYWRRHYGETFEQHIRRDLS